MEVKIHTSNYSFGKKFEIWVCYKTDANSDVDGKQSIIISGIF